MGLTGVDTFAFQGDGDSLLPWDQLLPTINHMRPVLPFRRQWSYSSWGYSLAGKVVEAIAGVSLASYVEDEILEPLKMANSTFEPGTSSAVAEPYAALSDASFFHLQRQVFKGNVFEPAAGLYSTVNDMLKWINELLRAISSDLGTSDDSGSMQSVVQQADQIFTNHVPLPLPNLYERSYSLGWVRTQLPGLRGVNGISAEGSISLPSERLKRIVGERYNPLIVSHQGHTVGYYSTVQLLPQLNSSIVVLTNGVGLCDTADSIPQAILQTILVGGSPKAFVEEAREMRDLFLSLDKKKMEEIRAGIGKGHGPSRPLRDYLGSYLNSTGNFFIDIRNDETTEAGLSLAFQGLNKHSFELRHWQNDTFEWALDWDELAKRGKWIEWSPNYFQFHFGPGGEEGIRWLRWVDDPDGNPEGQLFILTPAPIGGVVRQSQIPLMLSGAWKWFKGGI